MRFWELVLMISLIVCLGGCAVAQERLPEGGFSCIVENPCEIYTGRSTVDLPFSSIEIINLLQKNDISFVFAGPGKQFPVIPPSSYSRSHERSSYAIVVREPINNWMRGSTYTIYIDSDGNGFYSERKYSTRGLFP